MKQIKDMTTAEWRKAWTEIAVAFETEWTNRTPRQVSLTGWGLCFSADNVGVFQFRDLWEYFDRNGVLFLAPTRLQIVNGEIDFSPVFKNEFDLVRSTFAAMFAAMTPKEFLAICEAPQ